MSAGVVVSDASVVVAMLLEPGGDGDWAADKLSGTRPAAPTLLPFEVANGIRRLERAGHISRDQAAQAHADMLDLAFEAWPYELLARRAWSLRHNLSSYDASYVALAELLGVPLLTLDRRIAGAPDIGCIVSTP